MSVGNVEGGAGSGIDGGRGTLTPRLSGKSPNPGPVCDETCDFEAVEFALRKFIFLSSGRMGGRSRLVFLPVFRMVQSSFLGNEKSALNSDDLPCKKGSLGNELDAVISP